MSATLFDLNGFSAATLSAALNPRTLNLILLPTEKCNFRCTYCYEDFILGRMKPWLVDAIKKLIRRRMEDLQQLTISWFGGEPLLAKSVVLDISEHAYDLAKNAGVQFSGGLTTNGYRLDSALARQLIELKQNAFQITLDGDELSHNKTRILANGKGTFNTIWANLTALAEMKLDFSVALRMHLSPTNHESQRRLLGKINDTFGDDSRFSIHFHRVTDLGGPTSGTFPVYTSEAYAQVLAELQDASKLKHESEVSLTEARYICYAAKPNSLLIRSDGRLGKCTVALSSPHNHIGHVRENGELEIYDQRLKNWMLGYQDMDHQTLTCPWSTMGERVGPNPNQRIPITIAGDE